jgi:hypothetical protein
MSMLSVPDWGKTIAPEEWAIDETEQRDIADVFSQGLDAKLEKINALRGPELLIVVVLSIAIGAWLIMYISSTFFETKTQENKVITRRATKKVVKQVQQVIPAPWESMVDPVWMLDNCRKSILSLTSISTPGWRNKGVTCMASGTMTSWERAFGRLSWIEMSLASSGLTFASKQIDKDAKTVTVSIPFQDVRRISSLPKKSMPELRNMINDLFQAINLSINLKEGQVSTGGKVYNLLDFTVNSNYDPNIWKEMLTKFSGLKINNIRYNNSVWNYEGTIYVQ